ncbi:MAG: hypothetical protein AAGF24_09915 [Cyanobacteria bacterium P01_H01_bin.121]
MTARQIKFGPAPWTGNCYGLQLFLQYISGRIQVVLQPRPRKNSLVIKVLRRPAHTGEIISHMETIAKFEVEFDAKDLDCRATGDLDDLVE